MKKQLEKYLYTFDNVNEILLKQEDNSMPISPISKGIWKLQVICQKNNIIGVYFFNEDLISMVYNDVNFTTKNDKLNFILNNSELKTHETTIDTIKIFKEGFEINNKCSIFISLFFEKICGIMIVPN